MRHITSDSLIHTACHLDIPILVELMLKTKLLIYTLPGSVSVTTPPTQLWETHDQWLFTLQFLGLSLLPPHLHSNGRHTASGCLPHSSWVCLCYHPPTQQWETHSQWLFISQFLGLSLLPPHLHSNGRHTASGCLPRSSCVSLCSVTTHLQSYGRHTASGCLPRSSWVCLWC